MSRVAGGLVIGGGSLALLSGTAGAQARRTNVTDTDDGPINDRPNLGRGERIPRCTDRDSGPNSDPPAQGRGSGRTDHDAGSNSDPTNCGRR